jgi:hypothetical protein
MAKIVRLAGLSLMNGSASSDRPRKRKDQHAGHGPHGGGAEHRHEGHGDDDPAIVDAPTGQKMGEPVRGRRGERCQGGLLSAHRGAAGVGWLRRGRNLIHAAGTNLFLAPRPAARQAAGVSRWAVLARRARVFAWRFLMRVGRGASSVGCCCQRGDPRPQRPRAGPRRTPHSTAPRPPGDV